MSENEVLQIVEGALRPYIPERFREVRLNEHTLLHEDLGLNSSHMVDLIMDLEDKLELDPGDTYSFKTLGDVVLYVKKQKPSLGS